MTKTSGLLEPIPPHVATREQFRAALLTIPRGQSQAVVARALDILQFQYRANDKTITTTELANALDYATYNFANRVYGEVGKLVAEALNVTPPRRRNGRYMYWSVLSTGDPELKEDEHFRWVMRKELAEALESLPWACGPLPAARDGPRGSSRHPAPEPRHHTGPE